MTLLSKYSINTTLIEPLKDELLFRYNELNKNNQEDSILIKSQLNETEKKIIRLEERYIYGEIEKELYDKYITKLKEEKKGKTAQTGRSQLSIIEPRRIHKIFA